MAHSNSTHSSLCAGPATRSRATREHRALSEFAGCLGSNNLTCEPSIADEVNTRQEAKLLMSLLSSPLRMNSDDDNIGEGTMSNSESEQSYLSDSSHSSARRDAFSFTCPSLSLDRSRMRTAEGCKTTKPNRSGGSAKPVDPDCMTPAMLLGRPLKVDDRDALRLSADAMARNVLQSFQKAIQWRIQMWVNALSKVLVMKENVMLAKGASEEELKSLLGTREAALIVRLRWVSRHVSVSGASTRFVVLADRIEQENEEPKPVVKRRRFSAKSKGPEEPNDQYSVSYRVMFECLVNLKTPGGYSEISLNVPGTMDGTFDSSDSRNEELSSVAVDLDTNILAAMVEKGCRTVVRSSMEHAIEGDIAVGDGEEECEKTIATSDSSATSEMASEMTSPIPTCNSTPGVLSDTPRTSGVEAVDTGIQHPIVTPREGLSRESPAAAKASRRSQILLPIPDDLNKVSKTPRRISPQPSSAPDLPSRDLHLAPRTPKSRNTSATARPPLISPPLAESAFREVPENGPSLPLLVEVACRAMEGGKGK